MEAGYRFGFTASPNRAEPEKTLEEEEETGAKGNFDPEELLQCPYDKNHKIRACRLPYHLLKCKKNHPELASELKTCPYNALHLVPKYELARHTETCENRIFVEPEGATDANGDCPWQVPVSTWVNPTTSEDWDAETEVDCKPFMWGVDTQQDCQSERQPNNRLGRSFRPPNTFPWPDFKL